MIVDAVFYADRVEKTSQSLEVQKERQRWRIRSPAHLQMKHLTGSATRYHWEKAIPMKDVSINTVFA